MIKLLSVAPHLMLNSETLLVANSEKCRCVYNFFFFAKGRIFDCLYHLSVTLLLCFVVVAQFC